eukprot:365498-Chlamydomonas_euryale.AAC.5
MRAARARVRSSRQEPRRRRRCHMECLYIFAPLVTRSSIQEQRTGAAFEPDVQPRVWPPRRLRAPRGTREPWRSTAGTVFWRRRWEELCCAWQAPRPCAVAKLRGVTAAL